MPVTTHDAMSRARDGLSDRWMMSRTSSVTFSWRSITADILHTTCCAPASHDAFCQLPVAGKVADFAVLVASFAVTRKQLMSTRSCLLSVTCDLWLAHKVLTAPQHQCYRIHSPKSTCVQSKGTICALFTWLHVLLQWMCAPATTRRWRFWNLFESF